MNGASCGFESMDGAGCSGGSMDGAGSGVELTGGDDFLIDASDESGSVAIEVKLTGMGSPTSRRLTA